MGECNCLVPGFEGAGNHALDCAVFAAPVAATDTAPGRVIDTSPGAFMEVIRATGTGDAAGDVERRVQAFADAWADPVRQMDTHLPSVRDRDGNERSLALPDLRAVLAEAARLDAVRRLCDAPNTNCPDPGHDDRWCPRCAARQDMADEVLALLGREEP